MKRYLRMGRLRLFGAPVYFHWSVFAIVAVLSLGSVKDVIGAAVGALSFVGVVLLHEAGHAFFARLQGLRPLAIHVAALHGRCTFEEPESAKQDYIIAWGGVVAQLVVAVPLIAANSLFNLGRFQWADPLVAIFGYLSILIVAINLLPAEGLDGGKAWKLFPLLLRERRALRFVPSRYKHRRFRLFK